MARTLRSATRAAFESASSKYDEDGTPLPVDRATLATSSPTLILTSGIKLTPPAQVTLPALDAEETRILRRKQQRLRLSTQSTTRLASRYGAHITNSLHATYIFAQHEAGTAVCVDPRGWLVTCAHCFGESEAEWRAHRTKWLVADSGVAVQAECRAWDVRRDLALARIIGVEGATVPSTFAFVSLPALEDRISDPMMFEGTSIVCIGQPGADDLESEKPRKTDYALLEISEGELRGIISGADPQDNSEIGTLKHDAWTYWGHSGAPLLCRETGTLLGLHSSWDEHTAMRHGVPLVAIREFLAAHLPGRDATPPTDEPGKRIEVVVID